LTTWSLRLQKRTLEKKEGIEITSEKSKNVKTGGRWVLKKRGGNTYLTTKRCWVKQGGTERRCRSVVGKGKQKNRRGKRTLSKKKRTEKNKKTAAAKKPNITGRWEGVPEELPTDQPSRFAA